MMHSLIYNIIASFHPYAIFLGGGAGCNMTAPDSDIDLLVYVAKPMRSFRFENYHIIFKDVSKDRCINGGLLHQGNILYCRSGLRKWFEKFIPLNNRCYIYYLLPEVTQVSDHDAYKIVYYYNLMFNDNMMLDIRKHYSNQSQYNSIYQQVQQALSDYNDTALDCHLQQFNSMEVITNG